MASSKTMYNYRWIVFCVLLVGMSSLLGDSEAATYVVGDALGWTVPTNNPSAYATWASQHVFTVGDVLVFNYATGVHDVAKVTKQAYDSCSSSNPITLVTVGPWSFTLNSTGSDYYICTFSQHCSLGQKLEINVTSSPNPSPSPSPSPSQIPSPSPAPSSPGAPTPEEPQPPSSVPPGPESQTPPPPMTGFIPINRQPPPAPPPSSAPLVARSPAMALACVAFGLLMMV